MISVRKKKLLDHNREVEVVRRIKRGINISINTSINMAKLPRRNSLGKNTKKAKRETRKNMKRILREKGDE